MVYVKDLMNLESFKKLLLVSGDAGLNRKVSWPNIAQTVSIREWLVGGDVILMTGIGMDVTNELLISMVEQAVDRNAACIIMLLNESHIFKIPQETIQYAVEKNFPIFQAPWETKLSNVIRDISSLVFNDQYIENATNEFMEQLINRTLDLQDEANKERLQKYDLYSNHCVAIVRFYNKENFEKKTQYQRISEKKQIYEQLHYSLQREFGKCQYIKLKDEIIFIIKNADLPESYIKETFHKIAEHLKETFPHINFKIGIGGAGSGPEFLSTSYEQAKKALLLKKEMQVVCFRDLGLLQLLLEIDNQALIGEYVYKYLAPLLDYDAKYNQELVKTLKYFLQTNGNLVQTAQDLCIHRNTLVNRVEKIEEILQVSLKDADTRNTYYNCLKLAEFIDLQLKP